MSLEREQEALDWFKYCLEQYEATKEVDWFSKAVTASIDYDIECLFTEAEQNTD